MHTSINIIELRDKILFELKDLEPKYFREFNDMRIDGYFIFLNPYMYIVLDGAYYEWHHAIICKNNEAMTFEQLENCANGDGLEKIGFDAGENIIFEMKFDKYTGDVDDLTVLLTNTIKKFV